MTTPTPITEAHKALWTKLYNLAHDDIFEVASSDGPAHQLIADGQAEAVAQQTEALAIMVIRCDSGEKERRELRAELLTAHQTACAAGLARDQLRAEVERLKAVPPTASCGELSCDECNARTAALTARAERAEAELAKERARLDWLLKLRCEDETRDDIDAAMKTA